MANIQEYHARLPQLLPLSTTHSNAGPSDPSQASLPFGSTIDPVTQDLDTDCTSSPTEYSSTNGTPVDLVPPYAHAVAVTVEHHLYPGHHQGYSQSYIDIGPTVDGFGLSPQVNPCQNFNVTDVSFAEYDSYNVEDGIDLSSPFDSADYAQPYSPDNGIDSSLPFELAMHTQDNPSDDIGLNSPSGSGGPQTQTADEIANEKAGPHYFVDLKKSHVDSESLREIFFETNENGTFSCCLAKCVHKSGPFQSARQLGQHIRDVSNTRPFACGYCKESFKSRSDCMRHVESKNNPDKYPCQSCDKKFGRRDALNQHSRACHTDKNYSSKDKLENIYETNEHY